MKQTSTNLEPETVEQADLQKVTADELESRAACRRTAAELRLLWDERGFLFWVTSYGLLLAILIALLIPKRYESTARLMPPDNQSTSGLAVATAALAGRRGGLGAIAGDLLGVKSTSELSVGILRSHTVQDRIIDQFNLKKVYWDRRIEDARKDLEDRTDISADRKSQIITIKVTDKDRYRAAAMAQAYVDELNRLVAVLSTSSARRERVFLEERLKGVKRDLEEAEKEFSQFASKNTAIDIKEQGKAMVEAAATLQGQLIAAQSELEGLRQIYTDNNVRVRSIRARTNELQHQLEKLGGKGEGTSAGSSRRDDSFYPSIRKLPLLGVTYADLYRRTKIGEAIFETLTQEYELAKVEEAKDIPSVKVLDPANVPEKKSFPPRMLIIFLGTALAFSFGVVWVFGSTLWEGTDPKDPRKVLAQEVLGTVRKHLSWASRNGSRLQGKKGKF